VGFAHGFICAIAGENRGLSAGASYKVVKVVAEVSINNATLIIDIAKVLPNFFFISCKLPAAENHFIKGFCSLNLDYEYLAEIRQ